MAGNYPDVPSWRMAWDRDGSQAYKIDPGFAAITQLTSGQMQNLNDESALDLFQLSGQNSYLMIWFPEARDLDGYFFESYSQSYGHLSASVEVSTNTTNGIDGTWTQIRASGPNPGVTIPGYRSNIVSATQLGIRAIRFKANLISGQHGFHTIHLFGEPIPGANPNRLALWHPTLDERIPPAYLDWGDTPRSSSEDRTFRVRNLSSTLTANSVRVAMETLTDASPSVPAQHTLSYAGGSFLAQVNIGSLAPGATSGLVTFRRITPSNAQLGLWAFRVFSEATSWS